MLTADEFWSALEQYGMVPTDNYTADGNARFCIKRDGEKCVVSVHAAYPAYVIDKVLIENGFMDVPLYNSSQRH